MAADGPSLTLRVFLASPGDVPEERAFAREFLESMLPQDAFVAGRVTCHVVAWDHPHGSTTMPAHLTPQQAVIHYKHSPSQCDIVVVILASRLGTHLALDTLHRPDGSAYLSGTEWEYEDAWNATPRPDILVYQRDDTPSIDPRDREAAEKFRQFGLVRQFFARFMNPDGSWRGGFQTYTGLDGFRTKFANDVKRLVVERLSNLAPQPDPTPDPEPIVPPARCLGRDADVATLVAALNKPAQAALLVLGAGGIGKTTLTRRVATDAAIIARFGPRRWLVELETAEDAATLRTAIIQAIGLNPAGAGFPQALAVLARAPGLLVLDNLETPWELDPLAVQDTLALLAATPGVSLLASLRGGVAPPSPRWTLRPTMLAPLPEPEARALFLELAPGIAPHDPHLALFLDALGGVPLAVELVAMRAAGDASLRELWAEWQRRGLELAEHTDLPPDHRLTSVTRSLDLSWQSPRLREEGRHLFRLLGQSPAGLADADRAALQGDAAAEAARQLRAVGLAFERDARLDLLPPTRRYAQAAQPLGPEELDRWCRHFLARAEALEQRALTADSGALIDGLKPELANLEAAFAAARTEPRRPAAVAASWGFHILLRLTGLGRTGSLQALATACHADDDAAGEARCHYEIATILLDRSEHDAARDAYHQALPLYRQVGSVLGEANCIQSLGDIALRRSEHDAARDAYHQALPLFRQVGSVLGEANCIRSLGDIARGQGDAAAAGQRYQEALALYERIADPYSIGGTHRRLALVSTGADRAAHLAAARAAWQSIDRPDLIAQFLDPLG